MLTEYGFEELDWHRVAASAVGCDTSELLSIPLYSDLKADAVNRGLHPQVEMNSSLNLFGHTSWSNEQVQNGCLSPRTPQESSAGLHGCGYYWQGYNNNNNNNNSNIIVNNTGITTKYTCPDTCNPPQQCKDMILSPHSIYVPQDSRFFVIKSFNEKDVETSFLNKMWSSTALGNKRLNKAYQTRYSNERIFLFFSVNASGRFCGIAEMVSPLMDASLVTDEAPWTDKKRWRGGFKVQWLYVKDIYNNSLRHLKVPLNDFKPVTSSRDTQELPFEVGQEMLEIFKRTRSHTSFLHNLGDGF